MNALVCGAGPRGLEHLRAIAANPSLTLAAVCDLSPTACRRASDAAGVPAGVDLDALLGAHRPHLVTIAPPPRVRLAVVERAAACDSVRAIVVEKPLALDLDEARRMVDVCARRGIALAVCHQLRFSPEFIDLKHAVDSGALGRLESIEASCYGNLLDQGSHMVDLIAWLAGARPVNWVTAQADDDLSSIARVAPPDPGFRRDTAHPAPLWVTASIGFSGGLHASLLSGLLAPLPEPSLGPWLQKRVVVVGSDGVAEAHVASHFKQIAVNGHGGRLRRTGLASYAGATASFYAAVVETLNGAPARLPSAADLLHVHEVIHGCLESAARGRLVTLPFAADSPPRAVAPPDGPAVTIVLPLFDHRGLALQSVESWVLHQRAAPESFELIVILDDSVRAFEADLRARLRPWDQIVFASGNEMRQYHEAAVVARGRILFFTEPHCLAEPEAVGQVIHYFDTHDAAGMCGRTVPVMPNAVGRAESWMYDEGFRSWSQPDDWRKVILRAFGVRRDLYFDAGGFDHRYHRFAEWLLAARLHAKGHRLDYAPGVGVLHQYATSFGLLDAFNKEFTDGECLFRAEHTSPEFCERYFGSPPEWNEAIALDRPLLGLVTRALWQQARHRGGMTSTRHGAVTCATRLLALGVQAALGGRALVFEQRLQLLLAKARFFFWQFSETRQRRAFADAYMGATTRYRVEYAVAHAGDRERAPLPAVPHTVTAAGAHMRDVFGFHGLERHDGTPFRWSSAVAAVRAPRASGDCRVTVRLIGVRRFTPPKEISVVFNRTAIPSMQYDAEAHTIDFTVPHDAFAGVGENWLILLCRPWPESVRLGADPRPLGLPVIEVAFRPA